MRVWGDRVPSPATGLDAFASDARLQFYGGAFIEVARRVFRTVQDIDQVCLTEALREAAGVGPTTNLVQVMLVSSRGRSCWPTAGVRSVRCRQTRSPLQQMTPAVSSPSVLRTVAARRQVCHSSRRSCSRQGTRVACVRTL